MNLLRGIVLVLLICAPLQAERPRSRGFSGNLEVEVAPMVSVVGAWHAKRVYPLPRSCSPDPRVKEVSDELTGQRGLFSSSSFEPSHVIIKKAILSTLLNIN